MNTCSDSETPTSRMIQPSNDVAPAFDRVSARIKSLGLEQAAAELDAYGFTILEPGRAAPLELVDQLHNRIIQLADQSSDALELQSPERVQKSARNTRPTGQQIFYLLFEDPLFERALMNEHGLALIDYLLGEACVLSSLSAMVKGVGEHGLTVHTDSAMVPPPFPPYAQVANVTWLLTDYSRENGSLFVVPGSHKLRRHPTRTDDVPEDWLVPIEAPRGSLVIWHGALWHGSFPRKTSGWRVNLIALFCRMYMKTQEPYRNHVPAEVLARNDKRFARLMGQHIAYGWTEEGPDFTHPQRAKYLGLERLPLDRLFD
jgi:hypothetical protein